MTKQINRLNGLKIILYIVLKIRGVKTLSMNSKRFLKIF